MESEEDLAHGGEEWDFMSPPVEVEIEEENEEFCSQLVVVFGGLKMSLSEKRSVALGPDEDVEDAVDIMSSAWESSLRISDNAFVLTKEFSASWSVLSLLRTDDFVSVSETFRATDLKSCLLFWIRTEEWERSPAPEQEAGLLSLWVASVSDGGEVFTLTCSDSEETRPRLSVLRGMDELESTDRTLDLENSPLWGLLPEYKTKIISH